MQSSSVESGLDLLLPDLESPMELPPRPRNQASEILLTEVEDRDLQQFAEKMLEYSLTEFLLPAVTQEDGGPLWADTIGRVVVTYQLLMRNHLRREVFPCRVQDVRELHAVLKPDLFVLDDRVGNDHLSVIFRTLALACELTFYALERFPGRLESPFVVLRWCACYTDYFIGQESALEGLTWQGVLDEANRDIYTFCYTVRVRPIILSLRHGHGLVPSVWWRDILLMPEQYAFFVHAVFRLYCSYPYTEEEGWV